MNAPKVEIKRLRRGVSNLGSENPDDATATNPLLAQVSCLEKDLERRQESYVTRERAYKTRIEELEQDLLVVRQTKTDWMKSDGKMSKLKSLQGQIIKNVDLVQDQTTRVLQDQERDLLRSFRARLFDVQTELEKEKSKKDNGAGMWIARSRKLECEVDWAKEVADRLERINQSLQVENSRLKSQFNGQEEDRTFLISQLVHVKKENAQLKIEVASLHSEDEILLSKVVFSGLSDLIRFDIPGISNRKESIAKSKYNHIVNLQGRKSSDETKIGGISGSSTINLGANSSGRQGSQRDAFGGRGSISSVDPTTPDKYKDINIRLRRLLSEERRALQSVRNAYAIELRSRTDMEMLFRQCVDDVRKEISRRSTPSPGCLSGSRPTFCGSPNSITEIPFTTSFTLNDRERTIELLLSQEKVITLLYSKMFPSNSNGRPRNSSANSLDISRGDSYEGGADADILLAISKGLYDNSSTIEIGSCVENDSDGPPVSEGYGGPLFASEFLTDTVHQLSSSEGDRLPAI